MPSTPVSEAPIGRLRARIARLDLELLRLYSRRCATVRVLHREKDRRGLPRFDPVQEGKVVARARRWARELGLEPDLAEALLRTILAGSAVAPTIDQRPVGTPGHAAVPASVP